MSNELFARKNALEAAWLSDDLNLDKLNAYEQAEREYLSAVAAARAEWNALPSGDLKMSAEENAYDTEGTAEDELFWIQVAIRSYYV